MIGLVSTYLISQNSTLPQNLRLEIFGQVEFCIDAILSYLDSSKWKIGELRSAMKLHDLGNFFYG